MYFLKCYKHGCGTKILVSKMLFEISDMRNDLQEIFQAVLFPPCFYLITESIRMPSGGISWSEGICQSWSKGMHRSWQSRRVGMYKMYNGMTNLFGSLSAIL